MVFSGWVYISPQHGATDNVDRQQLWNVSTGYERSVYVWRKSIRKTETKEKEKEKRV